MELGSIDQYVPLLAGAFFLETLFPERRQGSVRRDMPNEEAWPRWLSSGRLSLRQPNR